MWSVDRQQRTEGKGGIVWLMEELRVFGLVILPTVIVAGLVVVYFQWRARLLDRIRDERNEHQMAA
jgi:hypothetical protein